MSQKLNTPISRTVPQPVEDFTVNSTVTHKDEPKQNPQRVSSKQRRLEYFRNGTDADCEIHIQCDRAAADLQRGDLCFRRFRCHRLFLATASDSLEQDVYQNKNWNGVLQINGVAPEAVEIFLEYIYTFEISAKQHADLNYIGDIYILANAYNIPELLKAYADLMETKIWPLDRIFPTFNLAFRHNIFDLELVCFSKILENARDLAKEPSLMELQIYALNFVIQHWLATESIPRADMLKILQQYQNKNGIKFSNMTSFPHFVKILRYFPNVLLDADGIISKF